MVALAACTELAPGGDRLPQTVAPNQPDAAPAGDPQWACLGEPDPGRADPLVPSVELALRVTDTVTGVPPDSLLGRACARRDVACSTPLSDEVAVDVDGALHLPVPRAFNGFVELRSPSTVPTMYFINRPLMRDRQEGFGIVSTLALQGLVVQGNVVLDPMLGEVLIRVFDCQGTPGDGVELANDRGGEVFAFVTGLPRVGESVTREEGIGGFINVPTDISVLQGIVAASGQEVGTVAVTVRAGWFSYGDITPAAN